MPRFVTCTCEMITHKSKKTVYRSSSDKKWRGGGLKRSEVCISINVDKVVSWVIKLVQIHQPTQCRTVDHNIYWQKFHAMKNDALQYLCLEALHYLAAFLTATNNFCNFSIKTPWYTALP